MDDFTWREATEIALFHHDQRLYLEYKIKNLQHNKHNKGLSDTESEQLSEYIQQLNRTQ